MLIAEQPPSPSMILVGGLYAAIGSVLGASIAYWVARLGARPVVDKLALIGIGYLLGNEWTLITVYLKQSLPFLLAGSAFALALYAWFTRRQPGYAPVRWNDE